MRRSVSGNLKDYVARHGVQSQEVRSRYRRGEFGVCAFDSDRDSDDVDDDDDDGYGDDGGGW